MLMANETLPLKENVTAYIFSVMYKSNAQGKYVYRTRSAVNQDQDPFRAAAVELPRYQTLNPLFRLLLQTGRHFVR